MTTKTTAAPGDVFGFGGERATVVRVSRDRQFAILRFRSPHTLRTQETDWVRVAELQPAPPLPEHVETAGREFGDWLGTLAKERRS